MRQREAAQRGRCELAGCNFAKVVLLALVVLGHSIHFWTGDWFAYCEPVYSSKPLSLLSNYISGFHVYAFTLISGYIYYYIRMEQGRYNAFLPFVLNKAKRLLVPYIFVTLVWLLPIQILFYGWHAGDIFTKFILAISPSHLWFLWMLFEVFVLVWPLSKCFDRIGGGLGCWYASYFIASGRRAGRYCPTCFAFGRL